MRSGLQVDRVWCSGSGLSCHSIGPHNDSSPKAHHALGLTNSYLVLAKCSTSVARKRTLLRHATDAPDRGSDPELWVES